MVHVRVIVPRPRFLVTLTAEAAALDEDAVERAAAGPGGGGGP
jgi:hypothetical protein